jgi:tetratricopeptide (TPR) repeat protein
LNLALAGTIEGLALGRELAQPYTLAYVLGSSAYRFAYRGDYQTALSLREEQVGICLGRGFDELSEEALVGLGDIMVKLGATAEGMSRIREGLAIAKIHRSEGLAMLAGAHARLGEGKEGLALIDRAWHREMSCDRRCLIAWLLQVKAELLLVYDGRSQAAAEECFSHSIDIARRQDDKAQELDSITRLSRLLKAQGRHDEALTMLAEIYNRFTEGFDTTPLKEAKVLLDELSG